jgi:hypothetical protein
VRRFGGQNLDGIEKTRWELLDDLENGRQWQVCNQLLHQYFGLSM